MFSGCFVGKRCPDRVVVHAVDGHALDGRLVPLVTALLDDSIPRRLESIATAVAAANPNPPPLIHICRRGEALPEIPLLSLCRVGHHHAIHWCNMLPGANALQVRFTDESSRHCGRLHVVNLM